MIRRWCAAIPPERWALTIAVLAFGTFASVSAGQDAALHDREYWLTVPRIGLAEETFMQQCGDRSLLLRRENRDGRMRVALLRNDWLRCVNDRLTKDVKRDKIPNVTP